MLLRWPRKWGARFVGVVELGADDAGQEFCVVALGGLAAGVAEQLCDALQADAAVEQVGGECAPQCVRGDGAAAESDGLTEGSPLCGAPDDPDDELGLHRRLVSR